MGRVVVLAAGQGYQLDGFNKLLLRDPVDGQRVLDKYIAAFGERQLVVVVGYRAITVMQEYPDLDYVYSQDWGVTSSSHSLALALDETPSYVLSADLFFDSSLIEALDSGPDNLVLTELRENRTLSALNCRTANGAVREVYQGKLKSVEDPEAIGIYKISDSKLLASWKRNCLEHGNLFAGQTLPLELDIPICAHDLGDHGFAEVNTPWDYLRLLRMRSGG